MLILPEEYANGEGDPLNGNPDNRSIEVLLRQAGPRLLHLEGVDQPEPEVHQGQQGHHVSAWMFRLSLPGDEDEDECFNAQQMLFIMEVRCFSLPDSFGQKQLNEDDLKTHLVQFSNHSFGNETDDRGDEVYDVM